MVLIIISDYLAFVASIPLSVGFGEDSWLVSPAYHGVSPRGAEAGNRSTPHIEMRIKEEAKGIKVLLFGGTKTSLISQTCMRTYQVDESLALEVASWHMKTT